MSITFMKCDDTGLNGYTDSDYASCKDDRRSITGFCFNVGSGAILWAARRQTCVATSTTEAELHALSQAVKEAVRLRGILDTLGESIATTLFTDSQSCLALAPRDGNSAKTKHFATRMAYVRETVKNQSIDLKFIARVTIALTFSRRDWVRQRRNNTLFGCRQCGGIKVCHPPRKAGTIK